MNSSDVVTSLSFRPCLTRCEDVIDKTETKLSSKIQVGTKEGNICNADMLALSHRPKLNRSEKLLSSLHDDCNSKISIVDRFPMKERLQVQSPGTFTPKEKPSIAKKSDRFDKIHIELVLQKGDKQHGRWLQHVKRLKYAQKSNQLHLPSALDAIPTKLKPFGNFVSSKSSAVETTSQVIIDKFKRPEEFSARRVTFNIQPPGVSMHTVASVTSKSTQSSNDGKTISPPFDHSHHKCARSKSRIFDKRTREKCFWSRKDMERHNIRSRHRANAFRMDYPATVKQLIKIFLETCNKSSTYSRDFIYGDDEDQEEMLRNFLRDWAASNVRGLEELVTGRNMFTDTRKMAVQSVLAYQQTLNDTLCATEVDRMSDLLRARSESTSQRARMFAMYLALGDALVANSNNNEPNDFDTADISINME